MDQASSGLKSNNQSSNRPWSFGWILLASVLCGFPGGYLTVWQDLKRIGQVEVAKKFLIIGGLIVVAIAVALFLLPISDSLSKGLGSGLSLMFPVWLYSSYLKKFQEQNPKVAGFSWSLLGWGLLGLILYIALIFLFAFIFPDLP